MAEARIRIAIIILALAYPVAVIGMAAWLAVACVQRWRQSVSARGTVASRIAAVTGGWLALTGALAALWFFLVCWAGMGIGHAPSKEDVAPVWLLVVITGAITGYLLLGRALRRALAGVQ